jgi:hypothetical protein
LHEPIRQRARSLSSFRDKCWALSFLSKLHTPIAIGYEI